MWARALRLLPWLLVASAGCDSFEPASYVQTLRVLAIRADPPEIPSGAESQLTPLVANFGVGADAGLAEPVTYEWALCNLIPRAGVDIDPACVDSDDPAVMTALPTLANGTTRMTMPTRTLTQFGAPDPTGGFYVPVRLRIHNGTETVTAFDRVRWQAGFVPPNNNPTLASVSYVPTDTDGELPDLGQTVALEPLPDDSMPALQLARGGKLRFRAAAAPGSAETYTTFVGDPRQLMTTQATELVRFFWYTSAGKVNNQVTGEERPDTVLDTTEFMSSLDGREGALDVWVVAREERGGNDFLHRRIQIR